MTKADVLVSRFLAAGNVSRSRRTWPLVSLVPPELGGQLDEAVAKATGARAELTEIAHGIHPAVLTERGLGAALRTFARGTGLAGLKDRVAHNAPPVTRQ
jgi:signal transduction histidine kinase